VLNPLRPNLLGLKFTVESSLCDLYERYADIKDSFVERPGLGRERLTDYFSGDDGAAERGFTGDSQAEYR
jgi:hypothetical protein